MGAVGDEPVGVVGQYWAWYWDQYELQYIELMGEKEADMEKGLDAIDPGETGDIELLMAPGNIEA